MKVRPRSRTSTADDDFHERCDRRGQTMATSTDLEAGASDGVAVAWRELRADDLPSLRLLDDHLFPVKYTDSFYRRLLSDGYFVVVAVAPSGEVVAVASARTVRYEDGGPNPTNDAYIMTLGVRDTFRRHRLGTKALQLLIQLLRERTDCVAAELHVKAENAGAMSFYKRFGFEIDPEHGFSRDHYYIEGHNYHAFYMRYSFVPRRNRWCTLL